MHYPNWRTWLETTALDYNDEIPRPGDAGTLTNSLYWWRLLVWWCKLMRPGLWWLGTMMAVMTRPKCWQHRPLCWFITDSVDMALINLLLIAVANHHAARPANVPAPAGPGASQQLKSWNARRWWPAPEYIRQIFILI